MRQEMLDVLLPDWVVPRRHGAASQHSDDAGDTSTAEISPQDNAAPVNSPSPIGISASEEASPAENKI